MAVARPRGAPTHRGKRAATATAADRRKRDAVVVLVAARHLRRGRGETGLCLVQRLGEGLVGDGRRGLPIALRLGVGGGLAHVGDLGACVDLTALGLGCRGHRRHRRQGGIVGLRLGQTRARGLQRGRGGVHRRLVLVDVALERVESGGRRGRVVTRPGSGDVALGAPQCTGHLPERGGRTRPRSCGSRDLSRLRGQRLDQVALVGPAMSLSLCNAAGRPAACRGGTPPSACCHECACSADHEDRCAETEPRPQSQRPLRSPPACRWSRPRRWSRSPRQRVCAVGLPDSEGSALPRTLIGKSASARSGPSTRGFSSGHSCGSLFNMFVTEAIPNP